MQGKFSVSLCSAAAGDQKPLQPKTQVPARNYSSASSSATRTQSHFPNPLTLETSRIQVAQERKDSRAVFLRKAEEQCSILNCSRREQYIATKMLLEETWRFYCRIRKQEDETMDKLSLSSSADSGSYNGCTSSDDESDKSQRSHHSSSSNPFLPKQQQKTKGDLVATTAKKNPKAQVGGRQFDKGMAKMLFFDIKSLMMSEIWRPDAEQTTAKHPYLFTINELRKMTLFAEWKNYL